MLPVIVTDLCPVRNTWVGIFFGYPIHGSAAVSVRH